MAKKRKTADLWRTILTLILLKDRTGRGQNVSFVEKSEKCEKWKMSRFVRPTV